MKRILTCLLASFITLLATAQSDYVGDWMGTLTVGPGTSFKVIFHITKTASGYSSTLDSPEQGAEGIPVSETTVIADSLHLGIAAIKGTFSGKRATDTTINGIWQQGTFRFDLKLAKTNNAPKLSRPQTPKPPFGYKADEVAYYNPDKSVHFGGTLTYPPDGKRHPAALLITGSGQEDRDETIFAHKPFAVLADYLTKQGYVVLRVDDRGIGKTTGDLTKATSEDFAKDVEAGIAFLKTQPMVDAGKIGLIGHSEGGLIAALVGSRRTDIYFMVLLASPGINGALLMAEQNEAILKTQGLDAATAAAYKDLYQREMLAFTTTSDSTAAVDKALQAYKEWKVGKPTQMMMMLGILDERTALADINAKLKYVNTPWMRYFLASDAGPLFEKTTARVLALNGEKDIQVIPSSNLAGIKSALQKSGSPAYDTRMLPGLNHLFQQCKKCSFDEYAKLEETFSPQALTAIGEWMKANVGN